jgi:hypothetical protein
MLSLFIAKAGIPWRYKDPRLRLRAWILYGGHLDSFFCVDCRRVQSCHRCGPDARGEEQLTGSEVLLINTSSRTTPKPKVAIRSELAKQFD